MASSANLSLNITAFLDTGKKDHIPPGMNFLTSPGRFDKVNVPVGNSTLTPPAGTNAIGVIVPPTTAVVTVKGVAGDVGIPLMLSPTDTRWFVLPFGTAFVVNSTAIINNVEVLYL